MKAAKHSNELNVDFIKSKPLTEKEKNELSAFIQKLKSKNKRKKRSKKTPIVRLAAQDTKVVQY